MKTVIALLLITLTASGQQLPFAFWHPRAGSTVVTNPVGSYTYWFNPDLGITKNGSQVVSWTDRVSSLVLRTNASLFVSGPGTATQNGHTYLTFSGTLGNVLTNGNPALTAPWEFTAVILTPSSLVGGPFPILTDDGSEVGALTSSSQWELAWNGTTLGGTPVVSTWYVVTCLFTNTGFSSFWVNGTSVVSQAGATVSSITGIEIGGFGTVSIWTGGMADIILYLGTVPTDAQRKTNEINFGRKYGLSLTQ